MCLGRRCSARGARRRSLGIARRRSLRRTRHGRRVRRPLRLDHRRLRRWLPRRLAFVRRCIRLRRTSEDRVEQRRSRHQRGRKKKPPWVPVCLPPASGVSTKMTRAPPPAWGARQCSVRMPRRGHVAHVTRRTSSCAASPPTSRGAGSWRGLCAGAPCRRSAWRCFRGRLFLRSLRALLTCVAPIADPGHRAGSPRRRAADSPRRACACGSPRQSRTTRRQAAVH